MAARSKIPSVRTRNVINDRMIITSVRSDMAQNRKEVMAERATREKKRGETKSSLVNYDKVNIDFRLVESLTLSFRNISEIKNLDGLVKLTTLRLDNNTISDISNLSHLVNLTWLDLSFNNIREIKGLETLVNLTDLSLCNNGIESLQGLDGLDKLSVLSIGNNKISELSDIRYLRTLSNLSVLSMGGNPVCEELEYRMVVLAFLKKLKYLDYILVEEQEITAAREQYQDDLMEIEEKENVADAMMEAEKAKQDAFERLTAAYVDPVENLFEKMFREDQEMEKISLLPGTMQLKDDFAEKMATMGDDVKMSGLKLYDEQLAEVASFEKSMAAAVQSSVDDCKVLLADYKKLQETSFDDIREQLFAGTEARITRAELQGANDALKEHLMENEIKLSEHCNLLFNEFETRYGELRTQTATLMEKYFRGAEDIETVYFESVSSLVNRMLEEFAKDELPDDVSDECRGLLADREVLNTAVATSHDAHLSKLLAVEEDLRNKANADFTAQMKQYKVKEFERNRDAIIEVRNIHEKNQSALAQHVRDVQADLAADEEYA